MALIFATYYCDPTYPIAHTPDVCCRQVGYTVSNMHTDTIDLSALGPEHANTEISVLDIERGGERLVVTFVLRADDKFCHTRDQARLLLSDPSDKYWYFSKIEAHAAFVTEEDRPLAEATAKKILTEVVPVLVEEYFPRTDDLKQP